MLRYRIGHTTKEANDCLMCNPVISFKLRSVHIALRKNRTTLNVRILSVMQYPCPAKRKATGDSNNSVQSQV